jgi:hypothetical protein
MSAQIHTDVAVHKVCKTYASHAAHLLTGPLASDCLPGYPTERVSSAGLPTSAAASLLPPAGDAGENMPPPAAPPVLLAILRAS